MNMRRRVLTMWCSSSSLAICSHKATSTAEKVGHSGDSIQRRRALSSQITSRTTISSTPMARVLSSQFNGFLRDLAEGGAEDAPAVVQEVRPLPGAQLTPRKWDVDGDIL